MTNIIGYGGIAEGEAFCFYPIQEKITGPQRNHEGVGENPGTNQREGHGCDPKEAQTTEKPFRRVVV